MAISVHRQNEIKDALKPLFNYEINSEEVFQALDEHKDPNDLFTEDELLESLDADTMREYCDRIEPLGIDDVLSKLISEESLLAVISELKNYTIDDEIKGLLKYLEFRINQKEEERIEQKRKEDLRREQYRLDQEFKATRKRNKRLTVSKN